LVDYVKQICLVILWTIAGFIWGMNFECYIQQHRLEVYSVLPSDRSIDVSPNSGMYETAKEMRTSAPKPPIPGKVYWADGIKWDPCGLGIGKSYYVIYRLVSNDYVALLDEDGNWYIYRGEDGWTDEEPIYFERKYVI